MADNPKRMVITVEELGERLGVGLSTAYEMVNDGYVRARQINRKWLIPLSALDEYLAGRDNPLKALSVDDVAEALGLHRNTISALIHDGVIRAVKAGRTWKIPVEALEEFLAGRDNPAKGEGDKKS